MRCRKWLQPTRGTESDRGVAELRLLSENRFSAASWVCDRTTAETNGRRSPATRRTVRMKVRHRDRAMASGSYGAAILSPTLKKIRSDRLSAEYSYPPFGRYEAEEYATSGV